MCNENFTRIVESRKRKRNNEMSAEKTTEKLMQALAADQGENSRLHFCGMYRAQ